MKHLMQLSAVLLSAAAFANPADPQISNVRLEQDSVTRRVTVKYDLDEAAVVTMDVLTNGVSIGGANIQSVGGDCFKKVSAGNDHVVTWNPYLSWPDQRFGAGVVSVRMTAWALDNTPDYMAVDITAAALPNTQTYYPAADFVPGGVTNGIYKTTKLLMRKIMAKGVTWTMGSTELETQRSSGSAGLVEQTHTVTLTNNFYIGVFPITQAQWGLVQTGRPLPSYFNNAGDRAMRPVEQVSFNEIRMSANSSSAANDARDWPAAPYTGSFLDLLKTKTGIYFDLPSEAQWEFSARAGNGDTQWGDGSGIQNTNLDGNLNNLGRYYANPSSNTVADPSAGTTQDVGGTAIVGTYSPNKWGLYDMHGNVWEVCLDWYKEDIGDLNGKVCNDNAGGRRVRRGGAWNYYAGSCRSASRNSSLPTARQKDNGLRVVCTAGLQ